MIFRAAILSAAAPLLATVLLASPLGATVSNAAEPQWVQGMAMHGDVKYGPDFTHFDYVNPDAPKGGTIRLGALGTFDSLNPFIVKGSPAAGAGLIYDTLMTESADEPFTVYGLLAEAIRVPKDRSWVEFRLRKEARFQDGTPVTPEDVIWTFNTLVTKGQPFYRFYYGNVSKVTQVGERTVHFAFKSGQNHELPLILGQLPVLPKHYWAGKNFDKTSLVPPLGSGPYRIAKVDPGRTIALELNDDYWGKDLPVNKGLNNFGRIIYEYYRDGTVALEAFKAGAFDYRAENISKAWATEYDVPAVKKGWLIKAEIHNDRPQGMQGFVFNTRRDMFKDRRVREALGYAFDFEWTNKNLFYGQYTRSRSYFDNSELAATGLPSADELKLLEPYRSQLPPEVFTREYDPPTTDVTGGLRANLRKASKLLTEAGWVVRNQERVNAKTGKPMHFEFMLVSPAFERVVLPFVQNLKRLGVTVDVRTVDSAQYVRRLDTYDFDMVVGSFGESQSPGNEQRAYWGTDSADQQGGRNIIGIKSPVVDALVEKIISADDRKALVTAVHALDRVLQWGYYVVPNWHSTYDRVAYWDMFGRPKVVPPSGNVFFAWWVDPARYKILQTHRGNSAD